MTFSVGEGTTYKDVGEKVLTYERSSRAWTMADALKQVAQPSTKKQHSLSSVGNDQGLAPMKLMLLLGKEKANRKVKDRREKVRTVGVIGRTLGTVSIHGRKDRKEKETRARAKESQNENPKGRTSTTKVTKENEKERVRIGAEFAVRVDTGETSVPIGPHLWTSGR